MTTRLVLRTDSPGPLPAPEGSWWEKANCLGVDPNLFFNEGRGENYAEARAVCAGCVVRVECLSYALENGEHWGIWGGTSERERKRMRRGRGPRRCPECGVPSPAAEGLTGRIPRCEGCRHGRAGTFMAGCRCEKCVVAENERVSRYRRVAT